MRRLDHYVPSKQYSNPCASTSTLSNFTIKSICYGLWNSFKRKTLDMWLHKRMCIDMDTDDGINMKSRYHVFDYNDLY